jgi:cytochrome oxidase Cu insertion factor (SCO1/SenC/PrrC family)
MASRPLQITTGVLLGATVGVLVIATGVLGPSEPNFASAPGWDPYPAPPLELTLADGSEFDLTSVRGEVALVFFGYASCPDFCPLTLATWTEALNELRTRGQGFQGLFVSVDPERDTPELLRRYMGNFDPSIRAVTGSLEDLTQIAADWGVYFFPGLRRKGRIPSRGRRPGRFRNHGLSSCPLLIAKRGGRLEL